MIFIICIILLCFVFLLYHSFFLSYFSDHRNLHSFPTRRSSDLCKKLTMPPQIFDCRFYFLVDLDLQGSKIRSEEHTSELQSRSDLVCRLLLEKKKYWLGIYSV